MVLIYDLLLEAITICKVFVFDHLAPIRSRPQLKNGVQRDIKRGHFVQWQTDEVRDQRAHDYIVGANHNVFLQPLLE